MMSIGATQLQRSDGFVPAVEAIVFVSDLITAVLLFSQARLIASRALLVLASGYLFSALIVVPHALTFPGAFSPTGLFGVGLQSTAWLYILWHFGLPAAVIGYVFLKKERGPAKSIGPLAASAVFRSVGIMVGLVFVVTWIAVVHGDSLPHLFSDQVGFTPLANYVTAVDFGMSVLALVLLWHQRRSVLDLWLTVAVAALVAELSVVTLVIVSRFSIGFYASRLFSVVVSTIVLIMLIKETMRLYSRLAQAHNALQLERDRKMANLDAMVGAIAHEVRQPLTSITLSAGAARRFLAHSRPDLDEVRSILDRMVECSFRVNDVFGNIRSLFKRTDVGFDQVDTNTLVLGVLRGLRGEMNDIGIVPVLELETELPTAPGHKGQLQEVVFNLVQNAIDALKTVPPARRHLRVKTEKQGREVVISVEDSGPGIAPEQLDRIFDAFFTTKKNGTGLGLAICRMIIERHEGQLSAFSQADRGARFEIRLPVTPANEDAPAFAAAAE
jgi:signal transduction histidine kinase